MRRYATSCAALLAVVAIAGIASRGASSGGIRILTGSINQVNKGWTCQGPVSLDSVTVTMNQNGGALPTQGANNDDAVHLSHGCTGTIGQITIVQYRGDGIKVGWGAHDLTVRGGSIRCLARDPGKHQDGVQVMGGQNVTFVGLDDRCQSSNNSALFINRSTTSQESPTNVICTGCYLQGGGITVRIGTSIRSGVRGSTIVAGHLSSQRIDKTSAVDAVWSDNTVVPFGSSAPGASAGNTASRAPTLKLAAGKRQDLPLAVRRLRASGTVQTAIQCDEQATLRVSAVAGSHPSMSSLLLPLLKASAIGTTVSGRTHETLVGTTVAGKAVQLLLRFPLSALKHTVAYNIRVTATPVAGGPSATLLIPFG
jgi:hypothetical protein